MTGVRGRAGISLLMLGALLAGTACPALAPEDRVVAVRALYSVELISYERGGHTVVLQEAPEVAEAAEETAGEAVAVGGEAAAMAGADVGEGESEEEMAGGDSPRNSEVLFDLLIRFSGDEPLPGITVDIDLVDAGGTIKRTIHHWVETPGLRGGESRQVPVELEVDEFEDGDQFSVEWNPTVPPEDRGAYREFSEAGG